MIALRDHLLETNNSVHRELLRLQDEFWFKTGISNVISHDAATAGKFDGVKDYLEGIKGVSGTIKKIMDLLPANVLANTALTVRDARLQTTVVATGVTTVVSIFAIEFTSIEKILVVRDVGGGVLKGVVIEKVTFDQLEVVELTEHTWTLSNQITIPGLSVNMETVFHALDIGTKALSTAIGGLTVLEGAFSENEIEQLHWIEGVLMIGAT